MLQSVAGLSLDDIKRELVVLRQGRGLAQPADVLSLRVELQAVLAGGIGSGEPSARDVAAMVSTLRRAIERLGDDERRYVEVDFNLADGHHFSTLTERQESLARELRCASKTVRRRADRALATLALSLVSEPGLDHPATPTAMPMPNGQGSCLPGSEAMRQLWAIGGRSRVDVVCSEIPLEDRPPFASIHDRNYLRYAKFADLDSLIYLREHLVEAFPGVIVRDFSPSEFYDMDVDRLVVIGGPPWNAKYREFLAQLPYFFEPHPLGEDDPLVIPQLGPLVLGPRWSDRGELRADVAVFTRLTLAQGTVVFLLGGCLTLGVLGAAKYFLHGALGERNAAYVNDLVGGRDFVLVGEARRVGGIADVVDLSRTGPLLLLAREGDEEFLPVVDNTPAFGGRRS